MALVGKMVMVMVWLFPVPGQKKRSKPLGKFEKALCLSHTTVIPGGVVVWLVVIGLAVLEVEVEVMVNGLAEYLVEGPHVVAVAAGAEW